MSWQNPLIWILNIKCSASYRQSIVPKRLLLGSGWMLDENKHIFKTTFSGEVGRKWEDGTNISQIIGTTSFSVLLAELVCATSQVQEIYLALRCLGIFFLALLEVSEQWLHYRMTNGSAVVFYFLCEVARLSAIPERHKKNKFQKGGPPAGSFYIYASRWNFLLGESLGNSSPKKSTILTFSLIWGASDKISLRGIAGLYDTHGKVKGQKTSD